jgi:hypothetical protein
MGEEVELRVARDFGMSGQEGSELRVVARYIFLVGEQRRIVRDYGGERGTKAEQANQLGLGGSHVTVIGHRPEERPFRFWLCGRVLLSSGQRTERQQRQCDCGKNPVNKAMVLHAFPSNDRACKRFYQNNGLAWGVVNRIFEKLQTITLSGVAFPH